MIVGSGEESKEERPCRHARSTPQEKPLPKTKHKGEVWVGHRKLRPPTTEISLAAGGENTTKLGPSETHQDVYGDVHHSGMRSGDTSDLPNISRLYSRPQERRLNAGSRLCRATSPALAP